MKLRCMSMTLAIVGVMLSVVYAAVSQADQSEATPIRIPAVGRGLRSISASAPVTGAYSIYLPLIASCYPMPIIADPGFANQPDMRQIEADVAWQHCVTGNPGVVVAIIDTGVDLRHSDLISNLIPGKDFIDGDLTPQDGQGHGTNVAGIVGAALNGIGVVGVAPATHLLPVRVLDDNGEGSTYSVAQGILYAADRAQILNLSLGSSVDDATVESAMNYAVNTKHRLVIAAGGNCGSSSYNLNGCYWPNQPVYPAAYSTSYSNVIAVGAVEGSDVRASFSNTGTQISVVAPGVSIYNAWLTAQHGGYFYESGTSQAAPHVTGLAALIWAKQPTYTAAQVFNVITSTAVDKGTPGWDADYGWGRITVSAAFNLQATELASSIPTQPVAQPQITHPADQKSAAITPGRILMKFRSGFATTGLAQILRTFDGLSLAGRIDQLDVIVLQVPIGREWQTIDRLRVQPDVLSIQPDYVYRIE